jgi:hypothetical protein
MNRLRTIKWWMIHELELPTKGGMYNMKDEVEVHE